MNRIFRIVPCIALLAGALLGTAPASGYAQPQPQLRKQLRDGEWQVSGAELPAPTEAPAAVRPQEDSLLGNWGRLVYTSLRTNNNDIFIRTVVGNSYFTTNLTNHIASDSSPRLNPAINRIAFVSNRDQNNEIYLMNLDGTQLRRLTRAATSDIQPFWSPDGTRLVFGALRDGNYNLYVMNADGSGQTRLTSDAAPDVMPAWSPDGQTIAWVRAGASSGAIWLMNADGTNQRPITGQLLYLQHPSWSPDGTQLAFDYDADGDGFNTPATVDRDGGTIQQVPVPSTGLGPDFAADYGVGAWAPPGDWLAVSVATYRLGSPLRLYGLYVGMAFLSGVGNQPLAFPEYDYQPDIRSLDHEAPTSALAPLPLYTRGTTATLRWSGADVGVAGGVRYDLQVRSQGAATWTPWLTGVTGTTAEYTGALGARLAFRVRARDAAGNVEPWHSAIGEAATTLFATKLGGAVADNRGRPVPDANLNLSAAPIAGGASDVDGRYEAYLAGATTLAIQPSHAGYGSPPATTLDTATDQRFSAYLLPTDNQAANGGFEANGSQATGWTAGGSLPAVAVAGGHTGANAARLGAGCDAPCLSPAETSPLSTSDYGLRIAAGPDGALHALNLHVDYSSWPPAYPLQYVRRAPNGVWDAAETIGNAGVAADIAVDAAGTVHAAWIGNDARLMYSRRPVNQGWLPPEQVGAGNDVHLLADGQGTVALVYSCRYTTNCEEGGFYRKRTAGSNWQATVQLPSAGFGAALDTAGLLHVAWSDAGMLWLGQIADGGAVSERRVASFAVNAFAPSLAVDPAGTTHLVWGDANALFYSAAPAGGEIAPPVQLPVPGDDYQLAVDPLGWLHLVNRALPSSPESGAYYRTMPAGGAWSAPTRLSTLGYAVARIAVDRAGSAKVVFDVAGVDTMRVRETARATLAGDAVLRQAAAVPASKPTLAFEYRLGGTVAGGASKLDVAVTAGATTTTVFSADAGVGWQMASVDLGAWAGQTVEVAFRLHQAAGAPLAAALLDDVSLGSWQTPVITALSPSRVVSTAAPTTLTIAGENFGAAPTVLLGTTPLPGVVRVDEQTLRVTVPAGTPGGRYILSVLNPGGQQAVRALVVGQRIALPLAWR